MRIDASELAPDPGATHSKKRVGRGNGSGHGTYSGKGLKGQKSRSGKSVGLHFEGGQAPLSRKLHVLRGFNNKWRTEYQPINLTALDRFEAGTTVTPELLRDTGMLKHLRNPVKVLGDGAISKKLDVVAHRFSASAKAAIEAAGGTATALTAGNDEEASS
jgi:large subunit ribosomal protein L15